MALTCTQQDNPLDRSLRLGVIAAQGFGWPQPISVTVLGAGVVVTSVVSGIDYVLRWSRYAAAGRV